MLKDDSVIVIGAGIAGLTSAALLAHEGIPIILLESHHQTGGCAGTFRRGKYIFDVGATQVAGLELGGIHQRLFRHLNFPVPRGTILDPACLVDLADGLSPVQLWHDPKKWKDERMSQFPGSESFWTLCSLLHKSNWSIASRDPVLPIRKTWDLIQLIKAIRLENIPSTLFSTLTVADLLKLCGCNKDKRLKKFLDMQLKLYSQETTETTAALYGATVLHMAQAPLGLWHLHGSMQKLSDHLASCLVRDGGKLLLGNRVVGLRFVPTNPEKIWEVKVINKKREIQIYQASDLVFTPPPQCLPGLIINSSGLINGYLKRLKTLSKPSGAIVFYGAINRLSLRNQVSSHFQLSSKEFGSIFVSISIEGDGRAPLGQATLIASVFADIEDWNCLTPENYQLKKSQVIADFRKELDCYFEFDSADWLHQELSTPRSFLKWTGRPDGIVGGLGQNIFNFGPFGLPSRTPLQGLWLCGDSIYPGEGTAGVSQSALMASKQLMANRGRDLVIGDC